MAAWAGRLLAVVFVLALAPLFTHNHSAFPGGDAQFRRITGSPPKQAGRIDSVYQSAIANLRPKKEELDKQEAELSRLIELNADEAVVTRQVDKVEAIRASLNKMRTLMLLRMRQVLTPDQRTKLNKIHDHWEKDHQKPPRGDNQLRER